MSHVVLDVLEEKRKDHESDEERRGIIIVWDYGDILIFNSNKSEPSIKSGVNLLCSISEGLNKIIILEYIENQYIMLF